MTSSVAIRIDVEDPQAAEVLRSIAESEDFLVVDGDDSTFLNVLIIALDLENPDATFARIETLAKESPATEICLSAAGASPNLLMRVMRAGVKEFFPQPLEPSEVSAALERIRGRVVAQQTAAGVRRGQIIGLIGGHSGVGTTTVAVNLGVALQHQNPDKSVAILDLNVRGGDITAFLDMNPLRGIQDIDGDLTRLDETFLSGIVSRHASGVHVLAMGEVELAGGYVSGECVERSLALMRDRFDFIVVDCGALIDAATQAVLETANQLLLVSGITVPVVRRTKRLMALLGKISEMVEAGRLGLVLSQCSVRDEALILDVSRTLGMTPICEVPIDHDDVVQAINDGQPLMISAPRRPIAKAIDKLAMSCAGARQTEKSGSFLSGVFKSFSGRLAKGTTPDPTLAS